nr:MAG TPA: hypothetical protein [Caudoviricetes sp.]
MRAASSDAAFFVSFSCPNTFFGNPYFCGCK